MKKITGLLFSMELTGMLLLLFTFSIGFATFIENDFGTLAAKARVYNARWFEIMLFILAINLAGSIIKHKMYLRRKWTVLLFHVAFLLILLGAGVTRYISYEGVMSIREGQSTNMMRSNTTYIRAWAQLGEMLDYSEKVVYATPGEIMKYSSNLEVDSKKVSIDVLEYYTNPTEEYIEAEGGEDMLALVVASEHTGRQDFVLRKGEIKEIKGYTFAFEADFNGAGIKIMSSDEGLVFLATDTIEHMDMTANEGRLVPPQTLYPFELMNLYSNPENSIVLKEHTKSALTKLVSREKDQNSPSLDAFKALVSVDGESSEVIVYGGHGALARNAEVQVNGLTVTLNYGSKIYELPFSLRLEDFVLERYPGSNSPASYSSQVTVIDENKELVMPYKIYMNNVLNYGGYRFFQSSYDMDEKGTILSVNHDTAGTILTYIGYFLLSLGMFINLFIRNSRFSSLMSKALRVRQARKELLSILILAGIFLTISLSSYAQQSGIHNISKEHADKFGKLLVQSRDGRLKPVNTVASEILRKVSRKTSFEGLTPEQVFLGIMIFPQNWNNVPMIKISHPQLKDFLGVEGKYASFNQLVDMDSTGQYLISDFVENAYAKKPANQNKFDKDVIQVDERVNIYYMVFTGNMLTVFPVPGDVNNKWVSTTQAAAFYPQEDSISAGDILIAYIHAVTRSANSGDWTEADKQLDRLFDIQKEYGHEIMLSDSKVGIEIFYNKFNIFKRLSMYYGMIGLILLLLHFVNILKPKINLRIVIRIGSLLVFLLFLMHTAGLVLRWYISGHAPWSNGYESMIYIAWATTLSGLIFVWRSGITLSVTALLASLILAVAGMNWMDPEITTLVPVLKSYWLIIHVAIITASYGFLGLGALLGFLNLLIFIMKSKKNNDRLKLTVKELSYVIEMTLIIGLFMLTIGTFLGGVWANESWGRYWGWDPKETWALATVLFYSFVVHMRMIPGLRGHFAFSFAALISFGFVIMTYFGVNYYLSGLHSYAAGDPVPVPGFVYYTVAIVIIVALAAYINELRVNKLVSNSTNSGHSPVQ